MEPSRRPPPPTHIAKAIAGISGTILTNLLLTPLDVLKVRQQASLTTVTSSTTASRKKIFNATSVGTALRSCNRCPHHTRSTTGGLMDRFFSAASRITHSASTSASTSTTTTPQYSTLLKRSHHTLCNLCGNTKPLLTPPTHGLWTYPCSYSTAVSATSATSATTHSPNNSMYTIFKHVVKHEGTAALWDGLRPAMLLSSINVVLYMIAYDELSKDILPNHCGLNADLSVMVGGGVSRAFAGLFVSPLELIRTQMQSSKKLANQGITKGMQSVARNDGMLSLWRGYSATMWRDVPFSIVYWYGFEHIKATIEDPTNNMSNLNDQVFLTSFVAGACSGSFAAFCTTPFDVIKTRRQVLQGKEARTGRLLLDIVRSEGVGALFSGVAPRVIKVAPACGILIGIYHYVQNVAANYV